METVDEGEKMKTFDIKPGASIAGLDIRMRPALIAARNVWWSLKQIVVVTSGLDGVHWAGSLHYYGLAVDLRTRYFNETQKGHAAELLQKELGSSFRVRVEKDHIHVEYNLERK
jgi:hypothetical protein